jgi:hypothetical protein
MKNAMIVSLPRETHRCHQSISVVLPLIHRVGFLLLNRSVTKYSACRSASRLTKCSIGFHRSWIFEIRMVGVRQMTVEGTSGAQFIH